MSLKINRRVDKELQWLLLATKVITLHFFIHSLHYSFKLQTQVCPTHVCQNQVYQTQACQNQACQTLYGR